MSLKLFTDQQNPENANPVVAVRWCVDKETLEELKTRKAANPHILLSVMNIQGNVNETRYGVETDRKLIPLGDMMSYVSFQRPGINVIYATVVWDQNNNTKNLKQRFLAKQDRFQWKNYVIEYHGAIFVPEYHTDCYTKTGIASLEMKIDEKLFAPEPFDKNWVNLFMEYNASNQCNYRKRRLFAYTIQIMMMFISF